MGVGAPLQNNWYYNGTDLFFLKVTDLSGNVSLYYIDADICQYFLERSVIKDLIGYLAI